MTEQRAIALHGIERDFVQIEAAMADLAARLCQLGIAESCEAGKEVRQLRQGLRLAYGRISGLMDEAANVLAGLDPVMF